MRSDPERDCSGFGFETPLSSIPACKDVASGGGGGGGTQDGNDDDDEISALLDDIMNALGLGDESSANTLFVSNSVPLSVASLLLLATVFIM